MTKKTRTVPHQSFVSPQEASKRLGVTTQTLRNWARKGRISFILLPSGRRHYDVDSIMAVMNAPIAPEPVEPLQPSPVIPVMPGTPNPLAEAIAVLMQDPKTAAHLRTLLAGAMAPQATQPEPVKHATISPMMTPEALKTAIESIAGGA